MVILENVSKTYSAEMVAVNHIDLKIERGELIVLIGPSGCGKTTTLKMINRIITPTSGKIYIGGEDTNNLDPVQLRRNIGYVIQNGGLFPHKTVAENIAVVPRLKKWSREEIKRRVDELLLMVGMDPDQFRNRYPKELSGGQKQRIGVLRALAAQPQVMLMDEPFGALDPITREQLQDELKKLQQKVQKTIVFVTHDMDEALKIADRIVVMKNGKIEQDATPREILKEPANEFIRNFIGPDRLTRSADQVEVAEIMSNTLGTVNFSQSVHEGLTTSRLKGVDTLMVTDNEGGFLGIALVEDLQSKPGESKQIKDLLVEWPFIEETENVKTAIKLMLEKGVRFLPVVDDKKQTKGIVTHTQVASYI